MGQRTALDITENRWFMIAGGDRSTNTAGSSFWPEINGIYSSVSQGSRGKMKKYSHSHFLSHRTQPLASGLMKQPIQSPLKIAVVCFPFLWALLQERSWSCKCRSLKIVNFSSEWFPTSADSGIRLPLWEAVWALSAGTKLGLWEFN